MATGKHSRFHHWVYGRNTYLHDYLEWSSGTQWGTFAYDAVERLTHAEATLSGLTAREQP